MKFSKDEEQKIINFYINDEYTLRHIADLFGTNHHVIKAILMRNDIQIVKHKTKKIYSEERRKKLSEMWKGNSYRRGKLASRETNINNMIKHFRFVDTTIINFEYINQFDDLRKLSTLTSLCRGLLQRTNITSEILIKNSNIYKEFIKKFWNDAQFNYLYNEFQKQHDIWIRPSLDHIYPISLGGTNTIDNVRIISWFENRCKNNLVLSDWEHIKSNIQYYFGNDRAEHDI